MNEFEFEGLLEAALVDFEDEDEDRPVTDVLTFRSAGVMTNNHGLVVRTADGAEFQVSVVRSK